MVDETLLSRIEDAGLNASAPPQQRWLDGWLLRFSPGKAKRARCVNAVAIGRLPLADKLRLAGDVFREAGLPMVVRITRFTQPAGLDGQLAAQGFAMLDDTRVMVCPALPAAADHAQPLAPPAGTHWARLAAASYAAEVGALRGSPPEQRLAHAERLAHSPVAYQGWAIRRDGDGSVLACGQFAREAELVGLYDIYTRESERGRGLARLLCRQLLALAAAEGAAVGYLQVDADNEAARRIYRGLGFADAYAYHYRQAPDSEPGG
ncbi:Acetyltransferase, GNAT family protein [Rubrivivax sp. A210]|uniref:GNAT family N-acetyltransferase n=1 Tax=Rubrivivax sp. A210 TaxID=2772301 RepID=UPI00191AFFAB|nr:GNAT family N-acetyltransferase [Rubrivivax sp. A210]CAD5373383.1 Acetyltransferase, GNAT family protein [Rubrivivax sp. A210]